MRISAKQIKIIRDAVEGVIGPGVEVRLFGSRLNDEERGGDIDLLVECPEALAEPGLAAARISARIQMYLGEQKIDVLVTWPGAPRSPVHQAALKYGETL